MRHGTIRGRLVLGFAALIALLVVAGVLARRTMTRMSVTVGTTLEGVQAEARQSAELSGDVAQTIEAAIVAAAAAGPGWAARPIA